MPIGQYYGKAICGPVVGPRARSHFHLVGAHMLSSRTCVGILPRWESIWQYLVRITNILKYLMEFLHTTKELDGLSDRIFSHWFPTRKKPHAGAGMEHVEDRQWRRRGTGGARLNEDVIQAGVVVGTSNATNNFGHCIGLNNYLIWLGIVNHKDIHFKFHNWEMRCDIWKRSKSSLSLSLYYV